MAAASQGLRPADDAVWCSRNVAVLVEEALAAFAAAVGCCWRPGTGRACPSPGTAALPFAAAASPAAEACTPTDGTSLGTGSPPRGPRGWPLSAAVNGKPISTSIPKTPSTPPSRKRISRQILTHPHHHPPLLPSSSPSSSSRAPRPRPSSAAQKHNPTSTACTAHTAAADRLASRVGSGSSALCMRGRPGNCGVDAGGRGRLSRSRRRARAVVRQHR